MCTALGEEVSCLGVCWPLYESVTVRLFPQLPTVLLLTVILIKYINNPDCPAFPLRRTLLHYFCKNVAYNNSLNSRSWWHNNSSLVLQITNHFLNHFFRPPTLGQRHQTTRFWKRYTVVQYRVLSTVSRRISYGSNVAWQGFQSIMDTPRLNRIFIARTTVLYFCEHQHIVIIVFPVFHDHLRIASSITAPHVKEINRNNIRVISNDVKHEICQLSMQLSARRVLIPGCPINNFNHPGVTFFEPPAGTRVVINWYSIDPSNSTCSRLVQLTHCLLMRQKNDDCDDTRRLIGESLPTRCN